MYMDRTLSRNVHGWNITKIRLCKLCENYVKTVCKLFANCVQTAFKLFANYVQTVRKLFANCV